MAVDDAEAGRFEINDPEEFAQKKRIRELLNRRTGVIDARDQAFDAMILGQITEDKATQYYRKRIESLILDLWTKFKSEDLDSGQKYLKNDTVDTITVQPPEELHNSDLADGETMPEPQVVKIQGLVWFIEHGPTVQSEFTVRRWNPPGETTVIGEREIPFTTLDKALVKCMEFIDDAGIDVSIEDSNDPLEV